MQQALPLIAKAMISMSASMILGAVVKDIEGISDTSSMSQENSGYQVNKQSMNATIPLLYGQTRVGINRSFVATSGSDNKYLHIIGILGEGEIEGFSDQAGGYDPVYFDNRLYTEYGAGNVYFELFKGTSAQTVCSTLNSAVPGWTDPLKHTAYIYLRLKFDRDKFQKVPDITVGIKGLKIYNPYSGVTEYTNNPALCVYDLLTRPANRAGFGLAVARINTASVENARSYCAVKGWTCNMPVNEDQSVTDNIQLLLNNFRGCLLKSTNQFYLKFKDLNDESVVMAFDSSVDRDIINGSLTVEQPDLFNKPTTINIEYLSEEGGPDGTSTFKTYNYILSDNEAATDENFSELKIRCPGLSDLDKVQQMAYYFLERHKLTKTCSFAAGQKAAVLEPLDLITLTHSLAGWDTKIFRVTSVVVAPDYTVSVNCIEENEDFYNSVYDSTITAFHDTTLPDPLADPSPVINASFSEKVYFYRNRSFTRLFVDFSPPAPETDPFFDYAEVYMKIGSGDYRYMTKSEGDYVVDPVEEGETYFFKLKSVNIFGNKAPDTSDVFLSKTIVGKTTAPANLSSMTAVAAGASVSIYADPIVDPDVDGYEVRLGDAWDGGIFISFNKNCSLRLNGVRPGTHTFWMSPKDNGGNYSGTPVSAAVKVFIPPGYTQLAVYGSWAWDFNAGTHDNTEHTTYNSEDALKCSHVGGVLFGTFISPTYDLNAVENVRVWGDFRITFVSTDTTWNGVAPAGGKTWNDLGLGSWMEIFQPTEAGRVAAILKFSVDGSNWSSVDFFQVLCAEVTARYLKVEITLTDPTLDSDLYLKELNMVAYTGPQG